MSQLFSAQDRHKASEIDYDENRNIIHLVITNRFGKELFRWDMGNKTAPTYKTTPKQVINDESLEWTDDEPKKDNLTMLTEFCGDKKNDETVDKKQQVRFYNFYKEKANTWKGSFNIPQLFNRWITTAKIA